MLIDGLQCGHFTPEVFEKLRQGGVGCVTVTCGFWEGAIETMDILGEWHDMARANPDLITIVRTAADIRAAQAAGKVAVLLGAQNSDLLDSRIAFVELFAMMGLRCMQLTYNTQNALACGCYETNDQGLTKFGREVVAEMNRCGILVDLSHVAAKSTLDAVRASAKPVAITHANAASLYPHNRNKSDETLRALRENGGVIGCATYRNITGDEFCASTKAWGTMVARTVDIVGIDHVGIGTDRSHGMTPRDYLWMRKGRWTRSEGFAAGNIKVFTSPPPPAFFTKVEDIGNLVVALREVGFNEEEVAKITHGNWLRVYEAVFGG